MESRRQLEQLVVSLVHAKRDRLLGAVLGMATFTGVCWQAWACVACVQFCEIPTHYDVQGWFVVAAGV